MKSATLHLPEAWQSTARSYAQTFEQMTSSYGKLALQYLALQPVESFLDIATGPGAVAIEAARKGAVVEAIDFSEGMIALLQERLQALDVKLTARVMDGQALTFADRTFDAALSCFGIFLFPDHAQGLREMFRVLKPGGRASIVVWQSPERMTLSPWMTLFQHEQPELCPLKLPPGWTKMKSEAGMRAELAEAGFQHIQIHEATIPCYVESSAVFVEQSKGNPFISQMLEVLPESRQNELATLLIRRLENEYGTSHFTLSSAALIGVAARPEQGC